MKIWYSVHETEAEKRYEDKEMYDKKINKYSVELIVASYCNGQNSFLVFNYKNNCVWIILFEAL